MTGDELAQLFSEVYQKYGVNEPAPGEFSVRQFADELGLSYNRATHIIDKAVAAGAIEAAGDRRFAGGKIARCYRRITPAL
jgi:hypothetical protein